MAHPCKDCGGDCFCHGDIDDGVLSKTPRNCKGCGCESETPDQDEDEFEPVGYECIGCGTSSAYPGPCRICGNEMDPYG